MSARGSVETKVRAVRPEGSDKEVEVEVRKHLYTDKHSTVKSTTDSNLNVLPPHILDKELEILESGQVPQKEPVEKKRQQKNILKPRSGGSMDKNSGDEKIKSKKENMNKDLPETRFLPSGSQFSFGSARKGNVTQEDFSKMYAELDEIGRELNLIEQSLPKHKGFKLPNFPRFQSLRNRTVQFETNPEVSKDQSFSKSYNVSDYMAGINTSVERTEKPNKPNKAQVPTDTYLSDLTQTLADSYDRAVMQLVKHNRSLSGDHKASVLMIQKELEKWRRSHSHSVCQQTDQDELVVEDEEGEVYGN